MKKTIFVLFVLIASIVFSQTTLVFQTHWSDFRVNGIFDKSGNLLYPGLKHYLEEYEALNPGIKIEIREVPFGNYLQQILVGHMAGRAADIYNLYSLWGVQLVGSQVLAVAPEHIASRVKSDFSLTSVQGATISDTIMGIPAEVNTYALIYNKRLFAEVGLHEPPETWDELVEYGKLLTKKDSRGVISQYGFAFPMLEESSVSDIVHPYFALLYSAGGDPFNDDLTKSLLDSQAAIRAMEAVVDLFKEGVTDTAGGLYDFTQKNVAMVIKAPWYVSYLKEAFGDEYEDIVGIAPIPYLDKPATSAYTFFYAVHSGSEHQEEAWKFLDWFALQYKAAPKITRAGELGAQVIGVIPPNESDLAYFTSQLVDLQEYVSLLNVATSEPNVTQGDQIKKTIMDEIVAAMNCMKTPEQAMKDAASKIDSILHSAN
ncbi:MAG TPA: extracellular solute-binding protein [Mesotoga infera]|uniref:Extracellular solute-binding protein n=1 Tax=Mesotoga infera TaxID=1236046 RepID=A0A7C1CX25_9BACT|nr:extracellular solute-binding protein [Mesotoga infera]